MVQDVLVGNLTMPEVEAAEIPLLPKRSLKRHNQREDRWKKTRILYDIVHRNMLLQKHLREDLTCTEVVAEEELELVVAEKGQQKSEEKQEQERAAKQKMKQQLETCLHQPDEATKAAAAKPIRKTKGARKKAATKKKQLKAVLSFGESKKTGRGSRRCKGWQ